MKFLAEIDGASKLVEDASNRLVSDTEKTEWNGKVKITISATQPTDGWWFKEI